MSLYLYILYYPGVLNKISCAASKKRKKDPAYHN